MTELTPPTPQDSAFHGQSVSLVRAKPAHQALFPYFLVALGTVLVCGVAGYLWFNSAARAEMEAQKLDAVRAVDAKLFQSKLDAMQRDLDLKVREAALAQQRDAQVQLAEHAETARKRVEEYEKALKEWSDLLAAQGREIAARDELLTKYQAIEREHPTPQFAPEVVRDRVTAVAKRSRDLVAAGGVTAAPSPETKESVDTDIAEANAALKSQQEKNQALRALVSEAKADGVPAANVDLNEAIELRVQRAEQARLQAIADAEERGRKEAEERIRELTDKEAHKRADSRVDAQKKAFDEEQRTIERLNDELFAAQVARDEEQVRIKKAELEKEIALLREKAGLAEAEVHVTEAAAAAKKSEKELEAERITQEAEKKRLREKAKSSEVTSALAPFLGKGMWQPQAKALGIDPVPVSLSALQAAGALVPSAAGLHLLYKFGASTDNDRSGSWPAKDRGNSTPDAWLKNKPDAVATARKAQQLLNELGSALVELGLLSP